MRLIDKNSEWESVVLPGFDKISLGQELQDIDLEALEKTIAKFPTYTDRLILVDAPLEVESAPQVPAPAPEPIVTELVAVAVEPVAIAEKDKPQPPQKPK